MARLVGSFSRPADATAYVTGDAIANSGTASAVVPITFTNASMGTIYDNAGMLTSCTCTITPASGNVVITSLDFDLLIFRPNTDIPFASGSYAADNAALSISSSAFKDLLAVFSFSSGSWRNPAGALTAGTVGWQRSVGATAPFMQYDCMNTGTLRGLVQAKGSWTPGAVVNEFYFVLDSSYQ